MVLKKALPVRAEKCVDAWDFEIFIYCGNISLSYSDLLLL